ncbi:MAG: flagellar hook-associated protein FlgL [Pseudomonadales bacterium]|nr:flagellar hook-associated protein FlgL [Pseudomonadales bacterium]
MRISTQQIYTTGLSGVLDIHAQVAETQEKITTGKRVLRPSDDPVAAVRIQQVGIKVASSEQYNENIGTATTKLAEEENLLDVSENIIQRIRERVIQAESGALNMQDRIAIAAEIEERLGELYSVTNSRDAAGKYIFGGYNGETQSYVQREGGGYQYQGDSGQNQVQFSSNSFVNLNDSGKSIYSEIKMAQGAFTTQASPLNTSQPPAKITAGQVTDQLAFEGETGEQYQLTFNAITNVVPNGPNYTVTRISDGVVIGDPDQPYVAGENIEINRERFELPLAPVAGDTFVSFDGLQGEDYQIEFDTPNTYTITRQSDGTVVGLPSQPYTNNADIEINGMRFQIIGSPETGDSFDVNYSDSMDMLSMVEQIVHALKDPSDIPTGDFSSFVAYTLDNLLAAETSLLEARVKIGARMNVGESSSALNENLIYEGKKNISELRDLDYAEALSDLAFQTFVLEAAQNSFVKISRLSLFNFIR